MAGNLTSELEVDPPGRKRTRKRKQIVRRKQRDMTRHTERKRETKRERKKKRKREKTSQVTQSVTQSSPSQIIAIRHFQPNLGLNGLYFGPHNYCQHKKIVFVARHDS